MYVCHKVNLGHPSYFDNKQVEWFEIHSIQSNQIRWARSSSFCMIFSLSSSSCFQWKGEKSKLCERQPNRMRFIPQFQCKKKESKNERKKIVRCEQHSNFPEAPLSSQRNVVEALAHTLGLSWVSCCCFNCHRYNNGIIRICTEHTSH